MITELIAGATFTGNKHCFQGRVEVLDIDEAKNQIHVNLTALYGNHVSNWNEIWDLQVVKTGLELGEYYYKEFKPGRFYL
jgi:hypothetical protein